MTCKPKRWGKFVAALILSAQLLTGCLPTQSAFSAHADQVKRVVVLDAGHGGADGGAVSADGVVESRINLEITQRLALLLLFCGEKCVLTRDSDRDLASSEAESLHERKVSDLQNRVSLVNNCPGAVLLSIHQNSLVGHPEVHGAQTFYNTVLSGKALADTIQTKLNQIGQPGNEKMPRQIDQSIYLLRNVACPAVLIECGFLSNPAQVRELCTPEHQKRLALAITAGYLTSVSEGII